MSTIRIQQVIATHRHEWHRWPDTDNTDYGDILAWRGEWRFAGDPEIVVENRYLPVFKAYLDADDRRLVVQFPWINNTVLPSPEVMAAQIAALEKASLSCQSIYWEHCHQCQPPVAEHIHRLFRMAAFNFADDMPGSSEVKTFPVAHNFDVAMLGMFVFDFATGQLTAPEYLRRGVSKTYHIPCGTTTGLTQYLDETGFTVGKKALRIADGRSLPVDFAWVGMANGYPWRKDLMEQMNAHGLGELVARLHGVGMRDGQLGSRKPYGEDATDLGREPAALYVDSLCGANIQQGSVFNCRLVDLWRCGVIQIIHDRHGELQHYGIHAGRHYVSFDGTYRDLCTKATEIENADIDWQVNRMIDGVEAANRLAARASWTVMHDRMYRDHLGRFAC